MDDIFVAGLCLLCWVSGAAFGWLRWGLPHLTAHAKGEHMNREEIDIMWNRALQQAIKDGEKFTRYHFATLIASHVRETEFKPDWNNYR